MRLPSELNPQVSSNDLPGGIVQYTITVTFGGEDHEYLTYDLSDYSGMNLLLKMAADGYSDDWTDLSLPPAAPTPEVPEKPEITIEYLPIEE